MCIAQWKFILFASFIQNPKSFYNGGRYFNYTGDLPRYVDRLFDNLTDKSYWNVDDRNNVDLLWIITRGSNSKF